MNDQEDKDKKEDFEKKINPFFILSRTQDNHDTRIAELEKKPCMSWDFAHDTEQNTNKVKKIETELRKVHDLALFNNDLYDNIKVVLKEHIELDIFNVSMVATDKDEYLNKLKQLIKKLEGDPFKKGNTLIMTEKGLKIKEEQEDTSYYMSQAEKDVFSALDGDKEALKRISESDLVFDVPIDYEGKEAEPVGIKETSEKLRDDLDRSLAKQRKDHPRIESNLIERFLADLDLRLTILGAKEEYERKKGRYDEIDIYYLSEELDRILVEKWEKEAGK